MTVRTQRGAGSRGGDTADIGPALRRAFDGLYEEHDYVVTETEGRLPAELRGTLYRNGPGKWESGGQLQGHVVDGDGMLSMFAFDGGQVRYRNRYVRTNHYLGGVESRHGVPQRGLGTLKQGGPMANALRRPANTANTSVVLHAGDLLALWEFGNPHAVDPDTLATLGLHDFDGNLGWLGSFSAHPKVDPATGDLFNFGFEIFPRPMLRCYRVDAAGRIYRVRDIPLPEPVFNHDFALTEQHLVFVIDPITVGLKELPGVALGLTNFESALGYRAEKGTTVVLAPRDGGRPTIIQTDPLMHFHINNAYEDGTDTIVDLVEWPAHWDEISHALTDFRRPDLGVSAYGGHPTRLRINADSGSVALERLSDARGEFPQFDWRRGSRSHRYTYLSVIDGDSLTPNAIIKLDHGAGTERRHILATEHAVSEPIFVPRSANAGEDEGWLLAVAYDPLAHQSRLLVLDAANPEADAIFIGHLRHHIPPGFHGTFTPRVADPGRPGESPDEH